MNPAWLSDGLRFEAAARVGEGSATALAGIALAWEGYPARCSPAGFVER